MELTRRGLLSGLLALPLARCMGRGGLRGETVGGSASAARAHVLREAPRDRPAPSELVDVLVVGGGLAGLVAGWTLDRAGLRDWRLLELEDEAGGTSRWGSSLVTRYPWAAHYVPTPVVPNPPLEALLFEAGAFDARDAAGRPLWREDVLCADPQERLFDLGEWHEGLYPRTGATADDLAQLARFEAEMRAFAERRDPAGRPLFAVPRALGSDDPEVRALDRLTMSDWMDAHGFVSPRLRWLVEYGCRDDFGGLMRQVSAWAGIHYHVARLGPDGEPAPVLTWPEGNGRLVRLLAERAGKRVVTGALALDVAPAAEHVDVTWLRDGVATCTRASHVVLAVPRHVVRRILAPWRESPPPGAPGVVGSWLVANVHVDAPPASRGFPLSWDNVIRRSPSLGYVVATHQTARSGRAADTEPTVLTWYHAYVDDDPRARREALLAARWEDLAEGVLRDLEPAHDGLRALVSRLDVMPWAHAMPRPVPGSCFDAGAPSRERPAPRIHGAHSDLSGMALAEEAVWHGVRAASEILREGGLGEPAWAEPAAR